MGIGGEGARWGSGDYSVGAVGEDHRGYIRHLFELRENCVDVGEYGQTVVRETNDFIEKTGSGALPLLSVHVPASGALRSRRARICLFSML